MLYDSRNPNSHYYDFLEYGRKGRTLTLQQELILGRRGNNEWGTNDGGGGD